MPKRTSKQRLIIGLESRGFVLDKAYVGNYGARRHPMRQPVKPGHPGHGYTGKRYFVGAAGGLRVGTGGFATSYPSDTLRVIILAEVPEAEPKAAPIRIMSLEDLA